MILRDDTNGHRTFALPGARDQYGPDRTVDVEHIDLYLVPDLEAETLDGVCTTTFRALDEPVDALSLDAVDLEVTRVERDGVALGFARRGDRLDIRFDAPVAPGERARVAIAYRTRQPRHGVFFVKPTPEYPHKHAHAWTQSQDSNARFWFPCLDYPHAKQTTSTIVSVPKGLFALANGALVETRDEGERTIYAYRQDVAHATYVMTMVVGPFVEIEQRAAGSKKTPLAYYVLPGREADGERAFANTPRMVEVFEEKIGAPYPYARYSQIAVSDFIFGGMENTSATTQTERTLHDEIAHLDFSSDPLVAHELAHQWFGDLLTCRDWSHAWLNEGFATYFECIWREADLGYDEYLYNVFECVARYIEEDEQRYRRPIVCRRFRDPIELFDRHLYEKGGAVLHMLRGELGDARFWRSIRRYVADNAQRNVETIDFVRAIEYATGRNMRGFFDQWVLSGGHPEIVVELTWDTQRSTMTVTVDQKQTIDDEHPAYTFGVDLGFVADLPKTLEANAGAGTLPGEKRVRVNVARARETFVVPLDREPALVRFDPGAIVLADVTLAFGVDLAAASLARDPDVVTRIRAARALIKDASKKAQEAVRSAFDNDPFWGVLVETASALGATRAPWARAILLEARSHEHPKVRRAVAATLGTFRDAGVASALLACAHGDTSYFVRAAAYESLGKTRDARALDALIAGARLQTWNGVVEAGAVRGLAELADARAMEHVISAGMLGRDEGVRRAVPAALARIGTLVESERTRAVDAIDRMLDDTMFMVQIAAVAAAESLGDPRLIPTLTRLADTAFDGRVRRDAHEAIGRIREARKVPAQVTSLREDLDALRAEQRALHERIASLAGQRQS